MKFLELYSTKLSKSILITKKIVCQMDTPLLSDDQRNKGWELLWHSHLLWSMWRQTFGPYNFWWWDMGVSSNSRNNVSINGMAPFQFIHKTEENKTTLNRLVMTAVFWDWKGVLSVDFIPWGQTINSEVYCQMLHQTIQNNWHGILCNSILFVHDNTWLQQFQALLQHFGWGCFSIHHKPWPGLVILIPSLSWKT